MAGLGYKDFTAGAVLTSAQVDGYLMEQAVMNFAGTAARGSALASVQAAGMVAHVGGGTLTVATSGSAWAQIYPSTPSAGLDFIAGTAFSAASSVSVNNCFTSTYDHYRIMINVDSNSVDNAANIRLRASGTDNSSSNYYFNGTDMNSSSNITVRDFRSAGLAAQFNLISSDNTDTGLASVDIFNPARTVRTAFTAMTILTNATDMRTNTIGGIMSVTTAYDGFSLIASTGTITGNLRVYGYRNA